MASQMVPALVDTVAVEFDCDSDADFRANGSVIAFPGFLRAYEESQPQGKEEKENRLPDMNEGDVVSLKEIRAEQHFTEPPPRFPKPAWSRRWKTSASGGHPLTPASSRPWCAGNTWNWTAGVSFPPTPDGWWRASSRIISSPTSITNSRPGWKTRWTRFPG